MRISLDSDGIVELSSDAEEVIAPVVDDPLLREYEPRFDRKAPTRRKMSRLELLYGSGGFRSDFRFGRDK